MTKARNLADNALSTVSPAELGFLDGVTSAVQTQIDGKTGKSTLTTTGDIYYASAASTPDRIGIGSTSQVLTVAGGIPSWATPAGSSLSLAQIATGTLSGASVNLTGLSSYDYLQVQLLDVNIGGNGSAFIRINDNSGSNYCYINIGSDTNNTFKYQGTDTKVMLNVALTAVLTGIAGGTMFSFYNTKAAGFTNAKVTSGYVRVTGGENVIESTDYVYKVAEAVSSLKIHGSSSFTGGTYTIWGG